MALEFCRYDAAISWTASTSPSDCFSFDTEIRLGGSTTL
ncbi:Uncharacterized protein HZ326_30503, partial [Fusarium oxysporum f. sp. albedinis]